MKRKTSQASSKVYVYGLLQPVQNAEIVKDQLFKVNQYFNARLELEIASRKAWRETNETWAKADEEIVLIDEQIKTIVSAKNKRKSHLGYQKHLIKSERRFNPISADEKALAEYTIDEKLEITNLKNKKKTLNETKKGARPSEESTVVIKDLVKFHEQLLRRQSDLYPATYELVDDRLNQIKRSPQSDVKFNRFNGEGSLGVRFTSSGRGGICKDEIFSCQDTQIKMELIHDKREGTDKARALVHFRVKSDNRKPVWAIFPMVYHRELPNDASVKLIKIVARKVGDKLKYELHLTLESKAFIIPRKLTGKSVGFDIGWRAGERAGFFSDVQNNTKIDVILPDGLKAKFEHAASIRSIQDKNFNEIKPNLVKWLSENMTMPERLASKLQFLHQWKSNKRLENVVWLWRKERFVGDEVIFPIIEAWAHKNRHLYQWWSNELQKACGWRKDFYANLAKKITVEYDTVYIENLNGSNMAKSKVAGGNRTIVAPFEFRQLLKVQSAKYGSELKKVPAPYTSMTCFSCGYVNEKDESLAITCGSCKLTYDRDENASRNIHQNGINQFEVVENLKWQLSRSQV